MRFFLFFFLAGMTACGSETLPPVPVGEFSVSMGVLRYECSTAVPFELEQTWLLTEFNPLTKSDPPRVSAIRQIRLEGEGIGGLSSAFSGTPERLQYNVYLSSVPGMRGAITFTSWTEDEISGFVELSENNCVPTESSGCLLGGMQPVCGRLRVTGQHTSSSGGA